MRGRKIRGYAAFSITLGNRRLAIGDAGRPPVRVPLSVSIVLYPVKRRSPRACAVEVLRSRQLGYVEGTGAVLAAPV